MINSSLKPIYANEEALEILSYPKSSRKIRALDASLIPKIQSILPDEHAIQTKADAELISGRRRYRCRSFRLESCAGSPVQPTIAVLMERDFRGPIDLSQVAEQFHLTRREREAIEHLIHGHTNKEIASRMAVSPNTVKSFLRMVRTKTGVSTRAGIVGKVLQNRP